MESVVKQFLKKPRFYVKATSPYDDDWAAVMITSTTYVNIAVDPHSIINWADLPPEGKANLCEAKMFQAVRQFRHEIQQQLYELDDAIERMR